MRPKHQAMLAAGLGLALGMVGTAGCGSDATEKPLADGAITADSKGGTDGQAGADAAETNPACTKALADKRKELTTSGGYTEQKIKDWPIGDPSEMKAANPTSAIKAATDGQGKYWEGSFPMSGKYWDDLTVHPGCKPRTTYDGNVDIFHSATFGGTNEAKVPDGYQANSAEDKTGLLKGYPCAAKIYKPRAAGVDESLPIVVLEHGNSGSPNHFEEFGQAKLAGTTTQSNNFTYTIDKTPRQMLATRLINAGFQVIASDLRPDRILTLDGVNLASTPGSKDYGDSAGNMDHGWGTPILQDLIKKLLLNTTKQISIVGHSYGYSVVRDALRRIYNEHRAGKYSINPYTRIKDLVLASGTAHGVAGGSKACALYVTLRGKCNCQMGDRDSFTTTFFSDVVNGPRDLFAAPCADGSDAFGKPGQCSGHVVRYTTVTMKDLGAGVFQDEYVSEAASKLNIKDCVDNQLISNTAGYDSSGFFLGGKYLANHLGTIRSDEGMALILKALTRK